MAAPFDSIILGGGTAGLTAGIYAARENLHALLLEKSFPGGQAAMTAHVENYPGFPEGISGLDLMDRMQRQAAEFGLEIRTAETTAVTRRDGLYSLDTGNGGLLAKTVIVCTGVRPRQLEVPGEREFFGRGVSTCATCDGAFFRGQEVAVIGGGDSAIEEGMYLTRFASTVHIIHRRDRFRAIKSLVKKATGNPSIRFHLNTVVTAIEGTAGVEQLSLHNLSTGGHSVLKAAGVFLYIGLIPNTELFRGFLDLNDQGFILVGRSLAASQPGVFAAGDVRDTPLRQIVTAAGDGALAAYSAGRFLDNLD